MQTIAEVITRLEDIIADCASRNDRAGYFAVLYHRVTKRVAECIANNEFEDGARMELLDVLFASRYLEAYDGWRNRQRISASWQLAFDAAADNAPLVMQHLLLGINAHINLDLGIAGVETMKGYELKGIQKDFNDINNVLAGLVDVSQRCLIKVNPLLKLLQLHRQKYDEMLVQFSINTAREGAWQFAQELNGKTGQAYTDCIASRDVAITVLGRTVARPKARLLRLTIRLIQLFERKNVKDIIRLLGE